MSLDEIVSRLQDIEEASADPEEAHHMEDRLRSDFLQGLADGTIVDIRRKARLILTSDRIVFHRWTA